MAEKRVTIKLGPRQVEVTEIDIVRRDERPAEYDLEDGATIRVANTAGVIYRMDEQDDQGNPLYLVKNGISVIVVKSPK